MENSELGRQARPGFEPGTSRFPVLSVTAVPLVGHWIIVISLTDKNTSFSVFLVHTLTVDSSHFCEMYSKIICGFINAKHMSVIFI